MADSNDLSLITFVPGTKAKADEVNSNFSTLSTVISAKAAIDGDSTQTFLVADATEDSHAVNKAQLNNLSDNLTAEVNKMGTKFCVKSGHTTSGKGNLFSYSLLTITPLIGGTYGDLVIADYEGTQTTISSSNLTTTSLNLTGNSSGTYNIFINTSGEIYILNNTIYKQSERPTMVVNDIWFNTSVEPFECIKYSGTSDEEFLDVPLGKVTIASSAITSIETFPFNQNGYNVTAQTTLDINTDLAASIPNFVMPDYTNGTNKSFFTVYQSASDGYLYILTRFSGSFYVSSGNADSDSDYSWICLAVNSFSNQGFMNAVFFPIAKGMYYKVTAGDVGSSALIFYPCLSS